MATTRYTTTDELVAEMAEEWDVDGATLTTIPVDRLRAGYEPVEVRPDVLSEDFALALREGRPLPPIVVRWEDGYAEIQDGVHRSRGAMMAGVDTILALVEAP